MIVFKNSNCTTEWLHDEKILINHWNGIVKKNEFIGTMNACMWFAQENPISHYVSDRTHLEYMWDAWEDWAVEHLAETARALKTENFVLLDPNRKFVEFLKEDLEQKFRKYGAHINVEVVHSKQELIDMVHKGASKTPTKKSYIR